MCTTREIHPAWWTGRFGFAKRVWLAQALRSGHLAGAAVDAVARRAAPMAEEHMARPAAGAIRIGEIGADDQVVVAVAIDIACRRYAVAHLIANRIALDDEAVAGGKAALSASYLQKRPKSCFTTISSGIGYLHGAS